MTRRRYEITNREWLIIAPPLPNKPRGVPCVDDRRVLKGILWRFRTGLPRAEVSERYGPPATCYNRSVQWRKAIRMKPSDPISFRCYDGDIAMIDSFFVHVHQHVAAGKKDEDDGYMERSRSGLISKIHATWSRPKAVPYARA